MLTLYLDETRRRSMVGVGGIVAANEIREGFEVQWRIALRKAGVKAFHATDFYNSQGEFKGWDQHPKRQREFSQRFCAIAACHMGVGVGRGVDV